MVYVIARYSWEGKFHHSVMQGETHFKIPKRQVEKIESVYKDGSYVCSIFHLRGTDYLNKGMRVAKNFQVITSSFIDFDIHPHGFINPNNISK